MWSQIPQIGFVRVFHLVREQNSIGDIKGFVSLAFKLQHSKTTFQPSSILPPRSFYWSVLGWVETDDNCEFPKWDEKSHHEEDWLLLEPHQDQLKSQISWPMANASQMPAMPYGLETTKSTTNTNTQHIHIHTSNISKARRQRYTMQNCCCLAVKLLALKKQEWCPHLTPAPLHPHAWFSEALV